jgi:hypothetical protein
VPNGFVEIPWTTPNGLGVDESVGIGVDESVGTGVGGAVGTGVGRAVGTGVGATVGTGVGGVAVAVGTGVAVVVGTGVGVLPAKAGYRVPVQVPVWDAADSVTVHGMFPLFWTRELGCQMVDVPES